MKRKFKYLTGTYISHQNKVTGMSYSGSYFTNLKDAKNHCKSINSNCACVFKLDRNENQTNEVVYAPYYKPE